MSKRHNSDILNTSYTAWYRGKRGWDTRCRGRFKFSRTLKCKVNEFHIFCVLWSYALNDTPIALLITEKFSHNIWRCNSCISTETFTQSFSRSPRTFPFDKTLPQCPHECFCGNRVASRQLFKVCKSYKLVFHRKPQCAIQPVIDPNTKLFKCRIVFKSVSDCSLCPKYLLISAIHIFVMEFIGICFHFEKLHFLIVRHTDIFKLSYLSRFCACSSSFFFEKFSLCRNNRVCPSLTLQVFLKYDVLLTFLLITQHIIKSAFTCFKRAIRSALRQSTFIYCTFF